MTRLAIYILYEVFDLVVAWYVISHIIYALYFRKCGMSKWLIALLPCGVTFLVNSQLMSLPKWVIIVHCISAPLALLTPWPCLLPYRAVIYYRDFLVREIIIEDGKATWAFMPFYRYYKMLRLIFKGGSTDARNESRS